MLHLQQAWTLLQGLSATKEDEKGTKISGILGNSQENILEGDEEENKWKLEDFAVEETKDLLLHKNPQTVIK